MRHTSFITASLTAFVFSAAAFAQPAPTAPGPTCQSHEAAVFAPGCDGPARLVCDSGASLPAGSEWCGCDGRTAQSASMAPPSGVRYRFRGACEVEARFEVTDERSAQGARTGRVVVFLKVGGGITEVSRVTGPCRSVAAASGELARITCGARRTIVAMTQVGDDVVVREGPREVGRIATPHGQRVTAGALGRF